MRIVQLMTDRSRYFKNYWFSFNAFLGLYFRCLSFRVVLVNTARPDGAFRFVVLGVKPLIHQSELSTYTKVVPLKKTNSFNNPSIYSCKSQYLYMQISCFLYAQRSDVPRLQQIHKSRQTAEKSRTKIMSDLKYLYRVLYMYIAFLNKLLIFFFTKLTIKSQIY